MRGSLAVGHQGSMKRLSLFIALFYNHLGTKNTQGKP